MNTVVAASSFAADTGGQLNRQWFLTGGVLILNTMVGDVVTINCLNDLLQLPARIPRCLAL